MFQPLRRFGAHRVLTASTAALVVLGLLAWWLWPREEPPTGTITISTGSDSGVYQEYGEHLRTAISKDMPGLKVELKLSDGSQENVQRVATGGADFAIAAADAVAKYRLENRRGAEKLRGMARLYDDYVQLVVPQSSTIDSVADLKGKRVGVGPPDSGVRLIANRVLKAASLNPTKDIKAADDGIRTGPEELREGRIDAFFWSGGLPTNGLVELVEKYKFEFRLVEIKSDIVSHLHRQGDSYRYYRSSVMPPDAYPSIQHGTAVPTITVANLLITRSDMDPRLTEWLTRVLIKSRDRIGGKVHAAQRVDLRTAIYTHPLPLDEGASRYYRSAKP